MPWAFSVGVSGMRMLNEFGMRGISLRLDLPFLRSQGLPGERASSVSMNPSRKRWHRGDCTHLC